MEGAYAPDKVTIFQQIGAEMQADCLRGLPACPEEMVVAEALDFPGAFSQGFDLPDARLMIASALEDLAQSLLEDGKALPTPNDNASAPDADLVELVPVSVYAGTPRT